MSGKCAKHCVAIGPPPKAIPIVVHNVHIRSCFAQSCVHARDKISDIPRNTLAIYPFVQKVAPNHK